MTSLVWFRNDLRLHDHAALAAAGPGPLVACFLLADRQWREHDWAPAKAAYTLANLRDLSARLQRLGIPLLVRRAARFAEAPAALARCCRDCGASSVHAIAEYEVDEAARDRAVAQRLAGLGLQLTLHHDQCILPPGSVLTGSGEPYRVFTPFRRRWLQALEEQSPSATAPPARQRPIAGLPAEAVPDRLPAFPAASFDPRWPVGEQAARAALHRAVEERLQAYQHQRDFPALDGTSGLSPCLASGLLAARHCLQAAISANHGHAEGDGLGCWITELVWRDFYRHVLVAFPQVCRHRCFDQKHDDLPWDDDPALELAWQTGRTGFPLIDAAMRQLLAWGWMHNRLRMVTAMFFSKNCLLDWRRGERFFMQHLIDGDLASNNGGWQWSASTGCDAAPYFRIFNPLSQSRRFDPEGTFLRRWLPELAELDRRSIHDPSPAQRQACGYPDRVLDLARSRLRAIAVFAERRS